MYLPDFKKTLKLQRRDNGQALILVLLALSVVLVTSLSVASRTVTDVSTPGYEEDSLRAFSAAEAGVEKMIIQTNPTAIGETALPDNKATYKVDPYYLTVTSKDFKYPTPLQPGESAVLWFVEHNSSNDLTCDGGTCFSANHIKKIAWGSYDYSYYSANVAKQPAIEISVYYDASCTCAGCCKAISVSHDYSQVSVARSAYDPNSGSHGNNFSSVTPNVPGIAVAGTKFHFSSNSSGTFKLDNTGGGIGVTCDTNRDGCLLLMTVRMLYNDPTKPDQIAIDNVGGSPDNFPAQGVIIDSTGKSGETVRRLNVLKTYPIPPAMFESSVYSSGDINKNITI